MGILVNRQYLRFIIQVVNTLNISRVSGPAQDEFITIPVQGHLFHVVRMMHPVLRGRIIPPSRHREETGYPRPRR